MTYAYRQGLAWSSPGHAAQPSTALLPAGPGCQPCPDCGGLECLCRPRFFAGQLLTEKDLNRLEDYILAKNRLHNRYLVGHGVVCGLEVTCSPCANTVSVSSGYAIDPCGNDIIVCSTDTVDVCTLIKACTPGTPVSCAPYQADTSCRDATQTWIIAIRYMETPSRGVTPLTGSGQCGCGASGGGACSCGGGRKPCGCGGAMSAASCCGETVAPAAPIATNLPRRGAPPACEPTVTCEAYRYEVFKPPIEKWTAPIGGDLLDRLRCCFRAIFPDGLDIPRDQADEVQQYNFCCSLRQALMQYLMRNGGTDCQALARLQAISCPSRGGDSFRNDSAAALEELTIILFEVLLDCFCSAALPPCPPPGDPRVPLAAVTVRASDCTILSICDWTPLRRHVVTNQTLGYWFGWLPFVPMIREFMLEACCNAFDIRHRPMLDNARDNARDTETRASATLAERPVSFATTAYRPTTPLSEAVAANLAGGAQALTLGDLLHAMLDPVPSDAAAQTLQAAPRAKVVAEVMRPLVSAFAPLLGAVTGGLGQTGRADAAGLAGMAAMRAELDSLKAAVAAQKSALDALRQAPPPHQG